MAVVAAGSGRRQVLEAELGEVCARWAPGPPPPHCSGLSLPLGFPATPALCLRAPAHGAPRLSRRRQGPLPRASPGRADPGATRPPSTELPSSPEPGGTMAAKLRAHQVDVDPDFAPQSRPRSCTWPLPQPDLVGDEDGALGSGVAEGAEDCGLERRATAPAMAPAPPLGAEVGPLRKAKSSRRNAWGNLSYADLITKAIESAPDKRLTLSQIYDWMVRYVPYFKDKGDSNSSAGWKVGESGWGEGLGSLARASRGSSVCLGSGRAGGREAPRPGAPPGVKECVPRAWGRPADRRGRAGSSCVHILDAGWEVSRGNEGLTATLKHP